jgi:uncharacterized protein
VKTPRDRVGLGWRGELASGILAHMDAIDLLEVIAENITDKDDEAALRELGKQVPLYLHGVAMGLASAHPVERTRLDRMARRVERVQPAAWSEHLAFVRAGGHEIGHLAAPPRTPANIAGTLANIAAARRVVGSAPILENIATLIEPPGSSMGEAEWLQAILHESNAPLLLDLHNLYANAVNFGEDPFALLAKMPLRRATVVHLSGGVWLNGEGGAASVDEPRARLLDDHLHDVPPIVFDLLEHVARNVATPLTVIIERDGRYPDFSALLAQISDARAALARGRSAQSAPTSLKAA